MLLEYPLEARKRYLGHREEVRILDVVDGDPEPTIGASGTRRQIRSSLSCDPFGLVVAPNPGDMVIAVTYDNVD
jgi:hypothetical protein